MELGLFQLENLFQNPNRFLFFDLRKEQTAADPSLDVLLKKAIAIDSAGMLSKLASENTPKDHPIILLDEDGIMSARVARDLENAGFEQIYIVAGGVAGLLSEV